METEGPPRLNGDGTTSITAASSSLIRRYYRMGRRRQGIERYRNGLAGSVAASDTDPNVRERCIPQQAPTILSLPSPEEGSSRWVALAASHSAGARSIRDAYESSAISSDSRRLRQSSACAEQGGRHRQQQCSGGEKGQDERLRVERLIGRTAALKRKPCKCPTRSFCSSAVDASFALQ